jgi:predicted RNA-binding Zn-ribbon protein involved in translation (DUF1610 family)
MDVAAVEGGCPNCGAALVVFPSTLLEQVGERTGSLEAEASFAGELADFQDATKRRYPVADALGNFTCPACGESASADDIAPA